MARHIELAHYIEGMGGQFSREKQKLEYQKNNNPLWNAPVGQQAALNFKPQLIITANRKTGKQSFRIQTKAIVDNTEPARLRMALFGAAQACVTAATHNPTLLSALYDAYKTVEDQYKSFRSWLTIWMRLGLKNKSATITIGQGVNIKNPWVDGGTGTELTISDAVIAKFAPYLCPVVVDIYADRTNKVVKTIGANSATMKWSGFLTSKFNDGSFSEEEGDIKIGDMWLIMKQSPEDEELVSVSTTDNVVLQEGHQYYAQ